MSGNRGGPWGSGGNTGGNRGNQNDNNQDRERPSNNDGGQIPEIDDLVKIGQRHFRVMMGGRGGDGNQPGGPPPFTRYGLLIGAAVAVGLWGLASFYTVKPDQRSVELFLGKYYATGNPGLNFAPWPLVTAEVLPVTQERTESIGVGGRGTADAGLMLTGDENIVDIDFQVVWKINNPRNYLFKLRDPQLTIRAVAESAMREIISQSQLGPILNRDRGVIADRLKELIQATLDSYESGVEVVRINFDKADPPSQVIKSFEAVSNAAQQRDRLVKQADAYANKKEAAARGEAAELVESAEGYRARVVNEAEGEASRFKAVLAEYEKAPDVTRKRLYLETMEKVLSEVNKVIVDDGVGGNGVVPYLPLNQLGRQSNGGSN